MITAAFVLMFLCLSAFRRERRLPWATAVGGAALFLLGALSDLADEFFKVPDVMKHWVENFLLASGALVMTTAGSFLLSRLLAEASVDPLTGLLNRRSIERALHRELARAARHNLPLAVVFADVNGLSAINNTYGHRAGDAALRLVATCLKIGLRPYDAAGRWGGDEFVVLLPQTDEAGAAAVVHRLKDADTALATVLNFPVGVSCGAAVYPADGVSAEELLAAADRRMYEEKGRHRQLAGPSP